MSRADFIRRKLSELPAGSAGAVLSIRARRVSDDRWSLWRPGTCACQQPTCVSVDIDEAVRQVMAWRPEPAQ